MNGDTPRLTARQKRILKAALAGKPPVVIASDFRCTPNAIHIELSRIRRAGVEVERFSRRGHAPASTLRLPRAVLSGLRREAKRRGISPRELAQRILSHAMKRGLVATLLDQEVSP
jgi:hypothetical protein